MKWFPTIVLAVAAALTAAAQAQPSTHVPGTVAAMDAQAGQVTVKTEKGETLVFSTNEKTQILHPQPGVADPRQWAKVAVSDIVAGDEVVAYFRGSADQKPLIATTLIIRTKTDLTQLAARELEDWKKRGTTGIVAAVNPSANTISVKVGARTVTVQAGEKTAFHRYSPDSAAAADAQPSTLAEVKAGDQLKVLGNKTADGGTIAAEVVYAGAFRQIPALIASIDPATGELKVTDLDTKKPLFIRINKDTVMKKLPPEIAQTLAMRFGRGGRGRGQGRNGFAPNQDQAQAQGGGPGRFAGRGGMRGGGGGRGGDLNTMLDGLPALQLADLKPKDAIMVTTTIGTDPGKVTATFLLAGVEDVLRAAPTATRDLMSGWNMGGGGEGGGGEGQ